MINTHILLKVINYFINLLVCMVFIYIIIVGELEELIHANILLEPLDNFSNY